MTTATVSRPVAAAPRLAAIDPAAAQGKAKTLLTAVNAKLGLTPNMMRTMAQSPAVLDAYLAFSGALTGGVLSGAVREQIALTVGEANGCGYCVAAHSALGKLAGLDAVQINAARTGAAADPKTDAILALATAVTRHKGNVPDAALAAARTAGVTDPEIAEVVANVALNILTNYFNELAHTTVDFPAAPALTR